MIHLLKHWLLDWIFYNMNENKDLIALMEEMVYYNDQGEEIPEDLFEQLEFLLWARNQEFGGH